MSKAINKANLKKDQGELLIHLGLFLIGRRTKKRHQSIWCGSLLKCEVEVQ